MGTLFSSGNRRIVSTEEVRESFSNTDMQRLAKVWQQVKRIDTLSHEKFRQTFLPDNTPRQLSQTFFEIYSSTHSSRQMNFEDFLEVYYLVHFDRTMSGSLPKHSADQRRAMLYFHILKNHTIQNEEEEEKKKKAPDDPMQDSFNSNIFNLVAFRYFDMTDHQISIFFQRNGLELDQ